MTAGLSAWYGVTLKVATNTIPSSRDIYLYGQELPWAHEPLTVVAEGAPRTLGGPLHFNGYAGRVIFSA